MMQQLFKTPDQLESFIRSLPVPANFSPKKIDEMIKLGRNIFEIRQVIAKSLLGNTKGFDKYAEIHARYVSSAVDETIGEDVRKLEQRLSALTSTVTAFDGFFDKIISSVNEASTKSNLDDARGSAIETVIKGYGKVVEELFSKAQEVKEIAKMISESVDKESSKSKSREHLEQTKLDQGAIKEKIKAHAEDSHERKGSFTKSLQDSLHAVMGSVSSLLGLGKDKDSMVKDLKRYCELQIEFNKAFIK